MNIDPRIQAALDENVEELKSSIEALRQKHGERKMVVALIVHNGGVLVKMLYGSGAGEGEVKLLAKHLGDMTKLLCDASQLNSLEIIKIAEGIDAQCAQLQADVIEAAKETGKVNLTENG